MRSRQQSEEFRGLIVVGLVNSELCMEGANLQHAGLDVSLLPIPYLDMSRFPCRIEHRLCIMG